MRWFERGLTRRLMASFVMVLTLVAALYAVAVTQVIEMTEQQLMSTFMSDELDVAVAKIEAGRTPMLPSGVQIFGTSEHCEPIPESLRNLPEGFVELVQEPSRFVYHRRLPDGQAHMIVRSQKGFEALEQRVQNVVALSVIVVLIIGLVLGAWLTASITRPIRALAQAVQQASHQDRYSPLRVQPTDDEVGDLAQSCQNALKRVYEALEREKMFTADVSHELRTPLSVARSSLELLQMRTLAPEQAKHADKIAHALEDMQSLLELFLHAARSAQDCQTDQVGLALRRVVALWQDKALDVELRL